MLSGCQSSFIPHYDGNQAFIDLEEQCSLGPRTPGSEAHAILVNRLLQFLQMHEAQASLQHFSYTFDNRPFEGFNVIGHFYPAKTKRVALTAHFDCRPHADEDPDSTRRHEPVLGANDGASGVALLMEFVRIIHEHKPPVGIDIIFFDQEDGGDHGGVIPFCIGSQHCAMNLGKRPDMLINFDMIADKNLKIYWEAFSYSKFPQFCEDFWQGADSTLLVPQIKHSIMDDHIPFLQLGIPAINVIDFDYPTWHTVNDTPEHCSAQSLQTVGDQLVQFIYRYARHANYQ